MSILQGSLTLTPVSRFKLLVGELYEQRKDSSGHYRWGGWAKFGHIPALQALKEDSEIVAVASRKKELAGEYKANEQNAPLLIQFGP